jgi:radical SAM superfamily enzyme YgiQ (UPF0313 family)
LKEIDRDITVVLGGHHVTAFPEETLRDLLADFGICGEGEFSMSELLGALGGGTAFSDIPGLAYRCNGGIKKNVSARQINNLDILPFPAWNLLSMDKYVTASILTSRGCPFCCIFCDKGVSSRRVKFRSPRNVFDEIVLIKEKYGKDRIYFVDDYFFLNKPRVMELFELLLKNNVKIKWSCQARVDGLDSEMLNLAKKSGCSMIIFGVETGDEEELRYIDKRTTLAQAREAIRLTKEAGITARSNFMIGFPISTSRSVGNSIRFAAELKADLYRFFVVSPLPNTVLWDRVQKIHPEISKISWDKFDFYSPSFDTEGLKKEELLDYVGAAYLYVLKRPFLREITIEFIPKIIRLLKAVLKTRRLRGNLSSIFSRSVNLLLEEWFLIRNMKFKSRLPYLKRIFSLQRKIGHG